jgi:hypothetical protein
MYRHLAVLSVTSIERRVEGSEPGAAVGPLPLPAVTPACEHSQSKTLAVMRWYPTETVSPVLQALAFAFVKLAG